MKPPFIADENKYNNLYYPDELPCWSPCPKSHLFCMATIHPVTAKLYDTIKRPKPILHNSCIYKAT